MTLRNEIFEGLAAAQATKNLIQGNPQDEYYRMRTEALKRQNQIDKEDRDELIRNRTIAQRGVGGLGRMVPVTSSTITPGINETVGYQTQDSGQQAFNTGAPPTDNSVTRGLPSLNIRKGGSVKKPVRKKKRRAIATGYRAGGPVTPPEPDEDEEEQDTLPPATEEEEDAAAQHRRDRGTPRNPKLYRPRPPGISKDDPAWIQRDDDEAYGYEDENIAPSPGREGPTQARQRFERGGTPESYAPPVIPDTGGEGGEIAAQQRAEAETEQDRLVKEIIAARAMERSARRRQGQLPRAGVGRVGADPPGSDELAGTFRDDAAPPDGADTDDSGLTQYAGDPNNPIGPKTQAEMEDPASYQRGYRPNIGPARALETSAPPADAKYPRAAPDPVPDPAHPGKTLSVVQPESSAGAWWNRFGTAHPESGLPEETGTEAAADERWRKDIMQRKANASIALTEAVTPEQRLKSEDELARIREEEKQGSPSERLRGRRRAIEAGAPPSQFIDPDKDAKPVGPILDAMRQSPAGRIVHNLNNPQRPGGTASATQAPQTPAAPARPREETDPRWAGEDRPTNMLYPRPPAAAAPPAPTTPAGPATTVAAPYNAEQNLGPLPAQNAPPGPPPTSRSTTANGPNQGGGNTGSGSGAGAQPAPPGGAIPDQSRTKAFDPKTERGIGAVDAEGRDIRGINTGAPPVLGAGGPRLGQPGGRADLPYDPRGSNQNLSTGYANEDIHQTLAGARSLVAVGADGKPVIGQGHVSRPLFQQYVQMHNQGGTLTPGDAMLRGMMSDYRTLLKQGRLEQANRMAAGVVQAANLEAASHGDVAVDQARSGNMQGSVQSIVKGLDYLPDGMKHTVSPDGRYMITSDPRTGKVTNQTPIDGRFVLAAAMGLKDGTLMWNTLNAAAATLNKDKDPAGRALSHDIKRAQLEGLILRNNRARTKGSGAGGVAMNYVDQQVRNIFGDNTPQTSREAPAGPSAEDMAYNNRLDAPEPAEYGGG